MLYETESSERNFNNKSEIEKLNDTSKKLGFFFKIDAINKINKEHDIFFKSNIVYEKNQANSEDGELQNESTNLNRLLKNLLDYDKFSKFLLKNFVIFPEFRSKPNKNINSNRQSPSGLELNNVLFNLKNGSRLEQGRLTKSKLHLKIYFVLSF